MNLPKTANKSFYEIHRIFFRRKRIDGLHAMIACVQCTCCKQNFHNQIAHGQLISYLIEQSAHESNSIVLPQKLLDLNSNRI